VLAIAAIVVFVALFALFNRKDTVTLIRELRRATPRERWTIVGALALVLLLACIIPWGDL
jgi:hypothetical protein